MFASILLLSRHSMLRRVTLALAIAICSASPAAGQITYPVTRTVDVADRFGEVTVADPYRWLEDLNAPETAHW
jgi:prolyl oligopeptidase